MNQHRLWTLKLPGDPRDYGYFEDKETAKKHRKECESLWTSGRKEPFYVAKGPDHPRLGDKGHQTTHTNGGNTGDGFRKSPVERRRQRATKKVK